MTENIPLETTQLQIQPTLTDMFTEWMEDPCTLSWQLITKKPGHHFSQHWFTASQEVKKARGYGGNNLLFHLFDLSKAYSLD